MIVLFMPNVVTVSVGKAIHIELYIPIQMARKISFFCHGCISNRRMKKYILHAMIAAREKERRIIINVIAPIIPKNIRQCGIL
jgi:hypothetical protein